MYPPPVRQHASVTVPPICFLLATICSIPFSVLAQPSEPYYYNGDTGWWWPGRIAGVTIAIIALVLVVTACAIILSRRRRMQRVSAPVKGGQPYPLPSWQQAPQVVPPPAADPSGYTWYNQDQSLSQTQGSQVGPIPPPPYYPPTGPPPPPPAHTSR